MVKRIAFLGIGNPLKSDDAVGINFIAKLKKELENENSDFLRIADFFIAGNDPFSFIFKIKNNQYKKVILVDACIFDGDPGEIKVFSPKDIETFNFVMTTHNYDLNLFVRMLEKDKIDVILVGIKPKNLEEGEKLSPEVENAYQKFRKIALSLIS